MFSKITSYIMAVITLMLSLFGLPFDSRYSSKPTVLTNSHPVTVGELDTHINSPAVNTRRKVDGTRLYIDNKNPLFRFHSFYIDGNKGEDAVKTYESLPEDVRAFSAILIGNYEGKDKAERYKLLDDALAVTDEAGVPIIAEIENWNSCEMYEGFSEDELCSLFENHQSLVGVAHVELFCVAVTKEECERLKTSIRAAEKHGALVVWADSELEASNSEMVFSQVLDDAELYNLMHDYSRNIVITDKHNGSGRHFTVQSEVLGCWLSGVCDNWGTNVESWLWWEEGLGEYGKQGIGRRIYSEDYINFYPPALAGIDTISDLVAGATVYSFEGIDLYRIDNGEIQLNEVWWSVLYPLYQQILNGAVPDKEEVASKIKTCYQVTDAKAKELMGLEADLFVNLYGPTKRSNRKNKKYDCTKKWIPTTGRYFIIPIMLKNADVESVLPNADIITHSNYRCKLGLTTASKLTYFNSLYPEKYLGTATQFTAKNKIYIFNNSENTVGETQISELTLSKNIHMRTELREHGYVTLKQNESGIELNLVNLRVDYRDSIEKNTPWSDLQMDYTKGLLFDNPQDQRVTTFVFNGFTQKPTVTVKGTNTVKASEQWNDGTYILQITSNGVVQINIA